MNKRGPKKVRRVRIGTRLTVEIRDRMMRHSAASGLSERAILENALEQYLGGTSDHAVLLRRPDQLTATLAEQRREHERLSEMFALFARFCFDHAAIRRRRAPRIPSLRRLRARLCSPAVPRLQARSPRRVLVQSRGLCPSCAGRRMAGQAAHLVDCVLPAVPIRQYVLSFPFELSALAATKPDVLRALARIHADVLGARYRLLAKRAGIAGRVLAKRAGIAGRVHPGSVIFVQRFGSSPNLHTHLHTRLMGCSSSARVASSSWLPRRRREPSSTRLSVASSCARRSGFSGMGI